MVNHFAKVILAGALLLLGACEDSPPSTMTVPQQDLGSISEQWREKQINAFRTLSVEAEQLQRRVAAFLENPEPDQLEAARAQWQVVHKAWIAYRLFVTDQGYTGDLDSWPIAAGFLDGIEGYPDSGIVNDETLPIDKNTILDQHGITDPSEASIGLHPIEFFLFARDPSHYQPGDSIDERRRQLLGLLTEILRERIGDAPVIDDSADADQPLSLSLQLLQAESERLFVETTQLAEGHGYRSNTQRDNIVQSMATITALAGRDSDLYPVLQTLDAVTAADMVKTLDMTDALLANPIDDNSLSRLPLLTAAMGHQFEDLNRALGSP